MSEDITPPVLPDPLDQPLVTEEDIKESAMSLQKLIVSDKFDKKELGDYVIDEVYDFYSEQRADELNRTLLALLPSGRGACWVCARPDGHHQGRAWSRPRSGHAGDPAPVLGSAPP